MRSILAPLACFAILVTGVFAQEAPPPAKSTDLSLTAVGRQHHPISTKSPEAQQFFDQGLTLIYGFNHEEAARAFERAAKLDPTAAMPYWGIAATLGPNYNLDVDAEREKLAFNAIQQAQKLAQNGPQVEKDYVAAMAVRYSDAPSPDYRKLAKDYAAAMRELSRKYPDDLDAATLYAESLMNLNPWKLWSNDGKPGENTEEIVAVLESVLARDPNHVGANHYYIHAVEASPSPERALPSADRLAALVPEAGHLVHMPAHIYERTGYFDKAERTNVDAARVDAAYAQKFGKTGSMYDLMYHSHNEHFEAMAAAMAGRYAASHAAANAMAHRLQPHAGMMPMLDAFIATPIWVDARFGKWKEILARPEPSKTLLGTHAMWRYSRVLALAAEGKTADAVKEKAVFDAEAAAIPADTMLGEQNKASQVLGVASHVMEARIAEAQGDHDAGIKHWTEAVAIQDTLNYNEPADWYYPVRESLGGALLRAGRNAEAEQVFRRDLKDNPRNPRSLFGLAESLKAQKKDADAGWVEREFQRQWKGADTKLSVATL